MSHSDPISEMLTTIRNAGRAKHSSCKIQGSIIKKSILEILKAEGYIEGYQPIVENNKSDFQIQLKYDTTKKSVIQEIHRISKPGRRVYIGAEKVKPVRSNMGIDIISTSKGIMTNKQAMKLKVGGEVLCRVF